MDLAGSMENIFILCENGDTQTLHTITLFNLLICAAKNSSINAGGVSNVYKVG